MNLVKTHQGKLKKVSVEVLVLRRMRIFRKISREDAAKAIEASEKLIEKFENGRCTFEVDRLKQLLRRYRYNWSEYLDYLSDPKGLPDLPARSIFKSNSKPRSEGRKYQKEISKASRVLKILRNMRGWSQSLAASKCKWSRSCIDHLENGRVELTLEKIDHVLKSYDCDRTLFQELMEATMLRDEVITEAMEILTKLDNDKLRAVKALLDNFT